MEYARRGLAPGAAAPGSATAVPLPGKSTLVDRIQPAARPQAGAPQPQSGDPYAAPPAPQAGASPDARGPQSTDPAHPRPADPASRSIDDGLPRGDTPPQSADPLAQPTGALPLPDQVQPRTDAADPRAPSGGAAPLPQTSGAQVLAADPRAQPTRTPQQPGASRPETSDAHPQSDDPRSQPGAPRRPGDPQPRKSDPQQQSLDPTPSGAAQPGATQPGGADPQARSSDPHAQKPGAPSQRGDARPGREGAHPLRDRVHAPAAKPAAATRAKPLHAAMAPAAEALQALAGVKPSLLPQAFPIAAAALEETRGRAGDAVADHHEQPPRAPAIPPATPPRETPEPPRRDPHHHAPIAHAPVAGQPAAPPAPDRVSAGPRPRVALVGASDPLAADARHQATHDALAGHRQRADAAAQRDFAIDRIPAPTAPLDRQPPPSLGGPIAAPSLPPPTARPSSPSSGASDRPPDTAGRSPDTAGRSPDTAGRTPGTAGRTPGTAGRTPGTAGRTPDTAGRTPDTAGRPPATEAITEAMLAPRVAQKITAAAASVRTVGAQSDAHTAAFEAQRQAAAQREAAEQAQLRATAAHRTEAVRGQWQQANTRLHGEHAARIAHKHEQMKRTVQDSVQHTEVQADAHLGDTEARGDREIAGARGRADAIRARAQARVSDRPAYDEGGGGGGGGETEAAQVLEEAQRLVEEMLTAARQHNLARVEELRRQVAQLLTDHAAELQSFIQATLSEFPLIGAFYQQQIDELMALVQTDSAAIALARGDHDRAATDALIGKLTHDLSLMKRYFGEIETIASYGGDLDQLRAAFGMTLGTKWTQEGKNYEEIALLAAITTEHAFRRSAVDGQMDDLGFGQGFQAVFGQMNLDYNSTQAYRYQVKQAADGSWYTYSLDTHGNEVVQEHYATQDDANNNRSPYGAETFGPHRVEFYDLAFRAGDRDPNNLLFNIIHEFGHAFNQNAHGTGYNSLDAETITAMMNGQRTDIAGPHTQRYTDEAHGMQGYPYQQNRGGSTGEEFADMFLNWVENSFVDNAAGRARFQWMNAHMWGDTGQRGVDGQRRWGWADTAIDRNSSSSQWVDPNSRGGRYRVQPGDTLQSIASRFGIDAAAIQTANTMGSSTDLSAFPVLVLPGVTQEQVNQATS